MTMQGCLASTEEWCPGYVASGLCVCVVSNTAAGQRVRGSRWSEASYFLMHELHLSPPACPDVY